MSTVEGSGEAPQAVYPGWPDAPNPDVNATYVKENSLDASGKNILGKGSPHAAAFALGEVPD